MERTPSFSRSVAPSYNQSTPEITISQVRQTLQLYLGFCPHYMTGAWLKRFLDVVKERNVDLNDKDATLKTVTHIRMAERRGLALSSRSLLDANDRRLSFREKLRLGRQKSPKQRSYDLISYTFQASTRRPRRYCRGLTKNVQSGKNFRRQASKIYP